VYSQLKLGVPVIVLEAKGLLAVQAAGPPQLSEYITSMVPAGEVPLQDCPLQASQVKAPLALI